MIGTIRKHQNWLWAIIIALVIVSFVFFTSANNRSGGLFGGGDNTFGTMGGHNITREEMLNALHEVALGTFLKTQQWPDPNSLDTQREAYMRLELIQKQKEMGIEISQSSAAAFARRILGGATLADADERLLKPQGLDLADFDRFLRHELGIEQMILTAGLSGKLVTPQEADKLFRIEHQDLDVSLAYFSASNYLSSVTVTPEFLGHFYTNQLANYRVPPQVVVSYVKFNVTNYLAEAKTALTNLDQVVEANVQHLGTNLYHNTKTPEESKAAIREDVLRNAALHRAQVAASEFLRVLDQVTPRSPVGFKNLAQTNHLKVVTTAPFGREYGPQDFIAPENFTPLAFGLATDEPYSGTIPGNDGIYVMVLETNMPSMTPAFADIKDKVTEDFRNTSAMQLAQQAVIQFHSTVTNGLANGKTWDELCKQAGVKPLKVPLFSLSSTGLTNASDLEEKLNFNVFKQVAFSTTVGNASSPAGARDGAYMLFVRKIVPVAEDIVKTDSPKFLEYMRTMRQNDAFNQWFNAEIRKDPEFIQKLQALAAQQSQQGQRGAGATPRSRPRS